MTDPTPTANPAEPTGAPDQTPENQPLVGAPGDEQGDATEAVLNPTGFGDGTERQPDPEPVGEPATNPTGDEDDEDDEDDDDEDEESEA